MSDMHDLLGSLHERAKELACLYAVEQALTEGDRSVEQVLHDVVNAIPPGWQYPDVCEVRVRLEDVEVATEAFDETAAALTAAIRVQGEEVGELRVCYVVSRPEADEGPFLVDEVRLINSLADRLGYWVLLHKFEGLDRKWQQLYNADSAAATSWRVLVDLLRETDEALFVRIARKMLNYLCAAGVAEAEGLLQEIDAEWDPLDNMTGEVNAPEQRVVEDRWLLETGRPFDLAATQFGGEEIVSLIQKWVQADKAGYFIKIVDDPSSSLADVREAIRRFHQIAPDGSGLPESTLKSVRVGLVQRLLTEQLEFVQAAKNEVSVGFFREIMDRIISSDESHGKLGGKAAGMLLAHRVLLNRGAKVSGEEGRSAPPARGEASSGAPADPLADVRIPRTWYVASDAILDFIAYNDLEDILHQKYKPIDEVRRDYPNIIRLFRNSTFPPTLIRGLSEAVDAFGDSPLIIRSSSLLEDRMGTAFSGKYKSLFLANQGTKQEKLAALLVAVAEVYASMFGPDPIQYRREHGVLDYADQMGVLIQEVVGKRVGKWFFPAFAGVAFSFNEFRWSPRIEREDGLVRLVPGLGTRAVDRTGDDYAVLLVPSKPDLRVNVAMDEVLRYSPHRMDVLDLESNTFETVDVQQVLAEVGGQYPALNKVFCRIEGDRLVRPMSAFFDLGEDPLVACFEGLRGQSGFSRQIEAVLEVLAATLKCPVDVEFAHDGDHLYLLQCRPQGQSALFPPSPIPRDIPRDDIVFTANRYVSNGRIADIQHIVYVDPERYATLGSRSELKAVGRAVGELNKLLPKKQFILMGPGRWGSRGDIKLGVSVTYADISNTAMLVEIARRTGNYVPDVSFGTHFFQDLVEASIGYLPIYPDDDGIDFGERFLLGADNVLPRLLPDFASLADTVRVIDVPAATNGRCLRVLLNADLDEAVAYIADPKLVTAFLAAPPDTVVRRPDRYWLWRRQMAERVAAELDRERFGVVAVYLLGSVKNATAGPGSDIDLLFHVRGSKSQRSELLQWLDGWSRCLAEFNYQRTGYRTDGLLDVHLVTDEDIAKCTSFAVKIGAVTDAALELPAPQSRK